MSPSSKDDSHRPTGDRERDVFARALEAVPSEREAVIRDACADDAALAERVLRLVEAYENAEHDTEAFAGAGAIAGSGALADSGALDRRPRETDRIGPYRILERIGEGGMGAVYLAEQREPIRRRVALKVIRAGMSSDEVISRFHSERRAMALMDHPGIARIFDSGATDEGLPYFVMEHVPGPPLLEYCDRRRSSLDERLAIFVQVCRAVQHAHHKGIIHRDLKPSNVLVVEVDGKPLPKVIDFGIAKAVDPTIVDDVMITQTGRLMGTPAYMSPEQVAGGGDVDTRSDVYALGVVLYELLTGAPPFDARSLAGKSFPEVQRILREVNPPIPSRRLTLDFESGGTEAAEQRGVTIGRLVSRVRGDLDQVVMKALEKERSRRYASPEELARDVERFLADEPVVASSPSGAYRVRKFVARHRVLVTAVSSIMIALVLGTIGTSVGFVRANRQRELAEDRERDAKFAAARAVAVRDFLARMLASADPLYSMKKDVRVSDILEDAVRSLDAGEFADDPDSEYAMRFTLGTALHGVDRLEEAERQLALALDLLPRTTIDDPLASVEARLELGRVQHDRGDNASSERIAVEALERLDALEVGDHELRSTAKEIVAGARHRAGDFRGACVASREALEISARYHGGDSEATARRRLALAFLLHQDDRDEEALAELDRALATLRGGSDRARYDVSLALRRRADIYLVSRRSREARADLREALDIREELFDDDSIAVADVLHDLGRAELEARDFAAAEAYLDRALEVRRTKLGEHCDTALSLAVVADFARRRGDLAKALQLAAEALEMRRRVFSGDSPAIADSLRQLGRFEREAGHLDVSEESLRASLELWLRCFEEPHFDIAFTRLELGMTLRDAGKYAEAADVFQAALSGFVVTLGPSASRSNEARDMLITVRLAAGDYDVAERLILDAIDLRRQAGIAPGLLDSYIAAQLGAAYLGQGRLDEAKPKLLEGWNALGGNPAIFAENKLFMLDHLVKLYRRLDDEASAQRYEAIAAELRPGG